jgi:hypothetical protein
MTADSYSSALGLILMGTGNNNNWGAIFNNSMTGPTDRAIAGVNTITSTGPPRLRKLPVWACKKGPPFATGA